MTVNGGLRKLRTDFFVPIPRETMRDKRLSFKARGLLGFLLDMPEGWDVRSEYLATQGKEGKDAVQTGLKELRRLGYYRLERRRLNDGRLVMGTAISESPVAEWAKEHEEFGEKPILCIQMPDGSFKVKHPDGRLTEDGFEAMPVDPEQQNVQDATQGLRSLDGDGPPSITGAGFSGSGKTGAGSPDAGLPDVGESRPKRETYKRDLEGDKDLLLDADATSDGDEPTLDLLMADASPAPAVTFDDFWKVYPRHVEKARAQKAWDAAVKKVAPEVILAGAQRFASDPNLPPKAEAKFIKHPATWLTAGCWDDEPLPPRLGNARIVRETYDDEKTWGTEDERLAVVAAQRRMTQDEMDALIEQQYVEDDTRRRPRASLNW